MRGRGVEIEGGREGRREGEGDSRSCSWRAAQLLGIIEGTEGGRGGGEGGVISRGTTVGYVYVRTSLTVRLRKSNSWPQEVTARAQIDQQEEKEGRENSSFPAGGI